MILDPLLEYRRRTIDSILAEVESNEYRAVIASLDQRLDKQCSKLLGSVAEKTGSN
jgi:hypothetical protein